MTVWSSDVSRTSQWGVGVEAWNVAFYTHFGAPLNLSMEFLISDAHQIKDTPVPQTFCKHPTSTLMAPTARRQRHRGGQGMGRGYPLPRRLRSLGQHRKIFESEPQPKLNFIQYDATAWMPKKPPGGTYCTKFQSKQMTDSCEIWVV